MGQSPSIALSVVVAARNEADSLGQLVSELDEALETAPYETELIIVDDCSTDATAEVLAELAKDRPRLRVYRLERRGGQTGCYRVGFDAARGRYIVRMDADLQDDPRDLPKFFALMEEEPDLIIGLRELRQHRRLLRIVTTLYDTLVLLVFDSPLHTNSSSFVAFRSDLVRGIPLRPNDHRYLPLIAMRRGARRLREVIVASRERRHGESKYKDSRKVLFGPLEVLRVFARIKRGYYDAPRRHGMTADR